MAKHLHVLRRPQNMMWSSWAGASADSPPPICCAIMIFSKRSTELFNLPLSGFMKGYPDEIKLWWDTYCPSNWGASSDETAAAVGIYELQGLAGDKRKDDRYTWPGGLGAITRKLSEI